MTSATKYGPIAAPNYTNTPNIIFDEWMIDLSCIQLKVLLVICRETFGWHVEKSRISLSTLKKYTGSITRNIIEATDFLIENGIIEKEVIGENGTQETYYKIIINSHSKNKDQCQNNNTEKSYTSVKTTPPPSIKTTPPIYIKKDNTKEKEEEEEYIAPPSPTISINSQKTNFSGLTDDEIKIWKSTYENINIDRELKRAFVKAISSKHRQCWRGFILKWLEKAEDDALLQHGIEGCKSWLNAEKTETCKSDADENLINKNISWAESYLVGIDIVGWVSANHVVFRKNRTEIKIKNNWATINNSDEKFREAFKQTVKKSIENRINR